MSPAYNDTAFLPLDIIADTLSCSVYLCDGKHIVSDASIFVNNSPTSEDKQFITAAQYASQSLL